MSLDVPRKADCISCGDAIYLLVGTCKFCHTWGIGFGAPFLFKHPCLVIVPFTQRPNAICHVLGHCVVFQFVANLIPVPTMSAVLHLWILMALSQARH